VVNHATFRHFGTADFYQIWSQNVFRRPITESGKIFSKIFTLRVITPPKSEIENQSNRHIPRSRLQVTGCTAERYCLFIHVVVQGPGSFRDLVTSLRSTVAELRGVKVAQFSDFGLFFPYKTPKTYLPVTSLQPRGYVAE